LKVKDETDKHPTKENSLRGKCDQVVEAVEMQPLKTGDA
jgi:hypothetical protein